jgi:CRP/FNR family transcriptional regulator, dissimilatory nitrate respiration regulator
MNAFPLTPSQISAILGRLGYFRDLQPGILRKLSAGARQITVKRGEAVFRKGDPADELFVVVSGQVKIFLSQANRTEKVVAHAGHGESFGIASLWLGLPHAANAVAKSDSHLLLLDRNTLISQARQDSMLAECLMTDLSQRVMDLMRDMESCTPRSSLQRVSCYLLQHRPEPGHGSYDILLSTTKRDVAAKLNLSQETLSRMFQVLSREGAIEVQGRMIRVLNSQKLVDFNQATCPPPGGIPE